MISLVCVCVRASLYLNCLFVFRVNTSLVLSPWFSSLSFFFSLCSNACLEVCAALHAWWHPLPHMFVQQCILALHGCCLFVVCCLFPPSLLPHPLPCDHLSNGCVSSFDKKKQNKCVCVCARECVCYSISSFVCVSACCHWAFRCVCVCVCARECVCYSISSPLQLWLAP